MPVIASRVNNGSHGFSLLELMFVVVIIAVVSIGTISLYRNWQQTQKIDEVIQEMDRVGQAAISYYLREDFKWPASTQKLIDAGYISQDASCSPLLVSAPSSQCKCGGHACYQIVLHDTVDQSLYLSLQLQTPNKKTSERLITSLPSSSLVNNNRISTSIPIPGPRALPNGLIIKQIEFHEFKGKSDTISQNFSCPPGWTKDYDAVINYIKNPLTYKFQGSMWDGTKLRPSIGPISLAEIHKDGWKLTLHVQSTFPGASARPSDIINKIFDGVKDMYKDHQVMLIKYCIPPDYNPYMETS